MFENVFCRMLLITPYHGYGSHYYFVPCKLNWSDRHLHLILHTENMFEVFLTLIPKIMKTFVVISILRRTARSNFHTHFLKNNCLIYLVLSQNNKQQYKVSKTHKTTSNNELYFSTYLSTFHAHLFATSQIKTKRPSACTTPSAHHLHIVIGPLSA